MEYDYCKFQLCILCTLFQSQEGYNMLITGYKRPTFSSLSAPVMLTLNSFVHVFYHQSSCSLYEYK